MKAKIKGKKDDPATSEYPCLKVSTTDGTVIVLFTSPNCGITVYSEYVPDPIGEYCAIWKEEERFTNFTGTIELSNN